MNQSRDTWNSEHYKKYSSFQNHEWALGTLEHINFKGDEAILDIGCGDGNITAKMTQKVPNGYVTGIDLSPNMIKAAKESYANITNLSFEIADAINFSFEQKFDLVTSFFVFHWIKDQLTALKNIKRALKPNGKIIIIMAAVQKDSLMNQAVEHLKQEGLWASAIEKANKRLFPQSTKDFKKLLDQAGFEHKKIEVVKRTAVSKTLDATVKTLMRSIPHSTELPYDQALKFSQALAENMYKQLNKKSQEAITFEQHFLFIKAQKT
jgi:trans-aconitate methyltransferase